MAEETGLRVSHVTVGRILAENDIVLSRLSLDELPEFGKSHIEVLRQPLEGQPREVSISRASGTITFPANFIAAPRPSWPPRTPAPAATTATTRIPAPAATA